MWNMPERPLGGCRLLVVEDEYMLADDLATELTDIGALVIGPAGTIEDALAMIAASEGSGSAAAHGPRTCEQTPARDRRPVSR